MTTIPASDVERAVLEIATELSGPVSFVDFAEAVSRVLLELYERTPSPQEIRAAAVAMRVMPTNGRIVAPKRKIGA